MHPCGVPTEKTRFVTEGPQQPARRGGHSQPHPRAPDGVGAGSDPGGRAPRHVPQLTPFPPLSRNAQFPAPPTEGRKGRFLPRDVFECLTLGAHIRVCSSHCTLHTCGHERQRVPQRREKGGPAALSTCGPARFLAAMRWFHSVQ